MQKTLFLVALLCASLAFVAANDEPVTDDQADCISNALRELEADVDHVGDLGEDFVNTLRRLREQRDRCEAILGDPPTALQERMHEACRVAWSASVAYELARLRDQSTSRDFFEDALTAVRECRNNNEEE